jgi:DNA-binding HxlR family transcriptional regulator
MVFFLRIQSPLAGPHEGHYDHEGSRYPEETKAFREGVVTTTELTDSIGLTQQSDNLAVASSCGQGPDPCPITPVVEVVFARWVTPVLWALQHFGPLRFTELRDHVGQVTPKVLTQRLRQLERDGLVTRTYYPEVPPRVEYEITDLGLSLSPAFQVLVGWAEANMDLVRVARDRYDQSGRPSPA